MEAVVVVLSRRPLRSNCSVELDYLRSRSSTAVAIHPIGGQHIVQGCADLASSFLEALAVMTCVAIAMVLTITNPSGQLSPGVKDARDVRV